MEVTQNAFTVDGFCTAYGVGRSLLYEEIRAGRIEIRKAGRRTLIRREDAQAWLDALPKAEVAPEAGK
ncbi:MAG: helix-turn-helix domain-containing protein [Mesorhizobium sp.]|nr:MAG: helix-turn-helix domain-containing protein [Mesorhizobium sp.]